MGRLSDAVEVLDSVPAAGTVAEAATFLHVSHAKQAHPFEGGSPGSRREVEVPGISSRVCPHGPCLREVCVLT